MKNTKSLTLFGLILLSVMILGCQNQKKDEPKKPVDTSVSDLETVIEKHIDSFYTVYNRFDYDWIDFFEDEFTNVFPDTPIRKISTDSTKALWKDIYERYEVQLISRGKPTFITSKDMVISHNPFNEIFIHKKSRDTAKNVGTYITAWRRQPDDSWKIAFETVQNN
ncbi:YybH family protein [Flagellimonas sp.]|uniref:YybH family protein n=1 Tax=Flagellimonas sp. TaxID=2058762 RepID=UPI003B59FE03